MHNNYYFLKQLVAALNDRLAGATLISCFSQNKDELVLTFDTDAPFILKAHLDPSFCCLSFPDEYHRARKNSVDLFGVVTGLKVTSVAGYLNERCFSIHFEKDKTLLFKMHGNRSNIILLNNDHRELFKNGLKKDHELELKALDRPIDQSYDAFVKNEGACNSLFPTFGPVVTFCLKERGFDEADLKERWRLLQDLIWQLEDGHYYTVRLNGQLHLSLLRTGDVMDEFHDPLKALNSFFIKRITHDTLKVEKNRALSQLDRDIKKARNYIGSSSGKLHRITREINYSQLGDILMANLHNIKPSVSEVTLPDFYNNDQPVVIKLKKDLSPQKNAEVYYRKAKNQSREVEMLERNMERKKELLNALIIQRQEVEAAENLKVVREINKQSPAASQPRESKPFRSYHFEGFELWVGKNARSNDEMLRNYANKDDLWLHARDVSGSHVLIKQRAGQVIPEFVIERAAELAAYYSKRKNDSVCPVIYTPRKFVRKRKGDPPGAVVVDREKVILVRPNG